MKKNWAIYYYVFVPITTLNAAFELFSDTPEQSIGWLCATSSLILAWINESLYRDLRNRR